MGSITHSATRDTAVDFSYPYFYTGIGYYCLKPYPLSKFMAVLWPFDIYLWIALIAAVPTTAAVHWLFSMFHFKDGIKSVSIGASLFQVLKVLVITSGGIRWPSSWHTRFIMTSWALFSCIIIFGMYITSFNFLQSPSVICKHLQHTLVALFPTLLYLLDLRHSILLPT